MTPIRTATRGSVDSDPDILRVESFAPLYRNLAHQIRGPVTAQVKPTCLSLGAPGRRGSTGGVRIAPALGLRLQAILLRAAPVRVAAGVRVAAIEAAAARRKPQHPERRHRGPQAAGHGALGGFPCRGLQIRWRRSMATAKRPSNPKVIWRAALIAHPQPTVERALSFGIILTRLAVHRVRKNS